MWLVAFMWHNALQTHWCYMYQWVGPHYCHTLLIHPPIPGHQGYLQFYTISNKIQLHEIFTIHTLSLLSNGNRAELLTME